MYSLTGAIVLYFSNHLFLNGVIVYGNPSDFVISFLQMMVFKGKKQNVFTLQTHSYGP
jgi:hypothetical protein